MPTAPPSPCTWRGWPPCPELVPGGGRCAEHTTRTPDRRPSAARRGYDRQWREKKRPGFLTHNPWCIDCGDAAEVPDHDPVERAELVRRGDPDPDAWHHLVPRCGPCHSRKTAATRPGGWHAPQQEP